MQKKKKKKYTDLKIHFGVGESVKAVCGVVKRSRRVIVPLFSGYDGVVITDDIKRVTCKRCLAARETRLRKLVALEAACPGILDRPSLCGEEWLFAHAMDITAEDVDRQSIEVKTVQGSFTLNNKIKSRDRREIFRVAVKI